MEFDTSIVPPSPQQLERAAALLKSGEIVGIPTETVYGLAANAYDPEAIKKIFLAKGRPQDNPLIVHIDILERLNELVSELPKTALAAGRCLLAGTADHDFSQVRKGSL